MEWPTPKRLASIFGAIAAAFVALAVITATNQPLPAQDTKTVVVADPPAGEWTTLFAGEADFSTHWDTYLGPPYPHTEIEGVQLKRDEKTKKYLEPLGLNRDPLKVYSVVMDDGEPAIRISGEVWGALTSKAEFENYHLKFEVKWGEKKWPPREKSVRDSGLLYHCVGAHGAGGGFWMRSFESQIQENDFGDFFNVAGVIVDVEADVKRGKRLNKKTGQEEETILSAMYKKGGEKLTGWTGRVIRNPLSEKPHGQWNTVELYAVGDTAVHVNNGVANMVLTGLRHRVDGKETPLTKGKIQLQSEGAEVYYRRVQIRPITKIPEEFLK